MNGKLLLIGWDAADWKVIHPLLDAGKLPNLARLIEGGVCGNLATLQPVLSPMLWTSIGTGKRPYKHGVHGFSEPDAVSGGIRAVSSLSRRTKAVWNILNQNDLRSVVVGWWPSHPAEPLTKGVMVSNHYQKAKDAVNEPWLLEPETVYPVRLEKVLGELRFHPGELAEEDLIPFLPGLKGMNQEELDELSSDPRVHILAKILAEMTSIHSAATALIQNEPWDFMAVYFEAIDHFGHAFMKYHPPRREFIDEREFRVFQHCLEGGYIIQDAMLGVLVDLAPQETTVMVMSDHGFHPDHLRPRAVPQEAAGPAVEHRQFGMLVASGPNVKADKRIYGASILDITPTILHHFGLPVGEDMDGKVLLDLLVAPGEIQRIASWDAVKGDDGRHPPDRVIAPADSKAALDQLVALGYIEKPDADEHKALENTVRELDYNLSQAYLDGGVYSEAIVLLERLYERWPEEHRFAVTLANCYHTLGRIAELRELVGKIIERRLAEARTAVAEMNALHLEDPAIQEAEKARLEKLTKEEQEQFTRERRALVARARPNLLALEALEAQADFAERKYPAALAKLEQLQKDYGARRNALTLRGEIHLRMRDWEEARIAFGEALEIDPEAPHPHLGMARAALAEGAFEDAADHAMTSIGLLFHHPRAHYLLGLAQYRAGDWENAERAFLIAVQQAPLLAAAYRMLSEIARHFKKDLGEALQYRAYARLALQRRVELSRTRFGEARHTQELLRPADEETPMPVLLPRKQVLKGVPESEIITVVTGLPRSGTSLMMQMLQAGGMEIFTDGSRAADEANPEGYFEHERVAGLLQQDDPSWMKEARGKVVKIVAPLLTSLPFRLIGGVGRQAYRVIFMERAMEEILRSQATMLAATGLAPSGSADIGKAYRQQVREARAFLAHLGIPALEVHYARLVTEPEAGASDVARFLGREASARAMASCVRPELYRARWEG